MPAENTDPAQARALVEQFPDPETGRPLGTMGQVKSVAVDGGKVTATIALTSHSAMLWGETRHAIRDRLREQLPGNPEAIVEIVGFVPVRPNRSAPLVSPQKASLRSARARAASARARWPCRWPSR